MLYHERFDVTNCKCYIMKDLTFLKKLILIKQVHQNNVIFVTIGIFR